jgi:hypothetical protein
LKKILIICVTTLLHTIVLAQSNDTLYLKIRIDSCTKKTTLFNSTYKDFEIAVKNSTAIIPLFSKDSIEIGMKIYVNQITEDEIKLTIVKLVILEKVKNDNWTPVITSEYYPLEELGNMRSVKIGSDQEIPDFFIQYILSVLYSKKENPKNKSILDLIPSLKENIKEN